MLAVMAVPNFPNGLRKIVKLAVKNVVKMIIAKSRKHAQTNQEKNVLHGPNRDIAKLYKDWRKIVKSLAENVKETEVLMIILEVVNVVTNPGSALALNMYQRYACIQK